MRARALGPVHTRPRPSPGSSPTWSPFWSLLLPLSHTRSIGQMPDVKSAHAPPGNRIEQQRFHPFYVRGHLPPFPGWRANPGRSRRDANQFLMKAAPWMENARIRLRLCSVMNSSCPRIQFVSFLLTIAEITTPGDVIAIYISNRETFLFPFLQTLLKYCKD